MTHTASQRKAAGKASTTVPGVLAAPEAVAWTWAKKLGLFGTDIHVVQFSSAAEVGVEQFDEAARRLQPVPTLAAESFIGTCGLGDVLDQVADQARAIFGGNVAIERCLQTHRQMGGEYLAVEIVAGGLSREEFRTRRREFFARVARLPDSNRLDSVVLSVTRAGH